MERVAETPDESREIRLRHKRLRDGMTQSEVQNASVAICESLIRSDWYAGCSWIYGYYPLGREVDCRDFLMRALADGKHVALPRVAGEPSRAKKCQMDFYEISSLEQVTEGKFGVQEPLTTCSLVQKTDAVVLVPGVVFDRTGNRYGYGRGYYDRYFARFPELYKLALSYEHQLEKKLRTTKTDVRMDGIYTERQCYLLTERTKLTHGIIGNL